MKTRDLTSTCSKFNLCLEFPNVTGFALWRKGLSPKREYLLDQKCLSAIYTAPCPKNITWTVRNAIARSNIGVMCLI